jgi:hypothetical protein
MTIPLAFTADAALISAIAGAAVMIIGAIATGVVTILNALAKLRESNKNTAADVKESLVVATAKSDKKTDAVLQLVNGAHTAALKTIDNLTTRLADATGDPVDIAASKVAEQNLADHQASTTSTDTPPT